MALPAGWYPVAGDPTGTQRYWDGDEFTTTPKRDRDASKRTAFAKPNSATKWRMANPTARVAAALIDYGAPIVIVAGTVGGMGTDIPGASLAEWADQPKMIAAIALVYFVNQVLLVGFFGVSLGRVLLGLRVVDSHQQDQPPGVARAFLRLVLLVPCIPVSAVFFVLGRRQGLHDLAAGTAVIYS